VVGARIELQEVQHRGADQRPADVEHPNCAQSRRPSRSEAHRQAQALILKRAKIFRQNRLLFELFGGRGGRVVHPGKLEKRRLLHAGF
jgi:hypothetical protein